MDLKKVAFGLSLTAALVVGCDDGGGGTTTSTTQTTTNPGGVDLGPPVACADGMAAPVTTYTCQG